MAVTPDLQQRVGELATGGEVQVGEEDLARAQPQVLGRERLLDLDDQFRLAKASAGLDQLRARRS